jgi:hypothetical protein
MFLFDLGADGFELALREKSVETQPMRSGGGTCSCEPLSRSFTFPTVWRTMAPAIIDLSGSYLSTGTG